MKYILFIIFLVTGIYTPALAIEKQDLRDVDITKFILETQVSKVEMSGMENEMHLVWWIPPEYWKASLANQGISKTELDQMMSVLQPYSIFGIVQGEILPSGVFRFYAKEKVANDLRIKYTNETLLDGTIIEPLNGAEIPDELRSFFKKIRPILTTSMGEMGQNFHFFFVEDRGSSRLLSPYEQGELTVELSSKENKVIPLTISTPLDSLHQPRICSNGKEAHISWQYCPWDGKKLSP